MPDGAAPGRTSVPHERGRLARRSRDTPNRRAAQVPRDRPRTSPPRVATSCSTPTSSSTTGPSIGAIRTAGGTCATPSPHHADAPLCHEGSSRAGMMLAGVRLTSTTPLDDFHNWRASPSASVTRLSENRPEHERRGVPRVLVQSPGCATAVRAPTRAVLVVVRLSSDVAVRRVPARSRERQRRGACWPARLRQPASAFAAHCGRRRRTRAHVLAISRRCSYRLHPPSRLH
jgi:hypothetical protein